MIRIKNQKLLKDESLRAINEELYLQELLSDLLSQNVVISSSAPIKPEQDIKFHYLRNDEGLGIFFNFSGIFPGLDTLQHYLQLVDCLNGLNNSQIGYERHKGIYFSDPTNVPIPRLFRKYFLLGDKGEIGYVIAGLIGEFSLYYKGEKAKESLNLNEGPNPTVINLRLGAIELAISDLLQLREGMQLEFELPDNFTTGLELSGKQLAIAEAGLNGKNLCLKLTKIATS